jgi:uncharacterized protein (DUF2344 family)
LNVEYRNVSKSIVENVKNNRKTTLSAGQKRAEKKVAKNERFKCEVKKSEDQVWIERQTKVLEEGE